MITPDGQYWGKNLGQTDNNQYKDENELLKYLLILQKHSQMDVKLCSMNKKATVKPENIKILQQARSAAV